MLRRASRLAVGHDRTNESTQMRDPTVYVINLARHAGRMATFAASAAAQGVAFERVEAVDAALHPDLPKTLRGRLSSHVSAAIYMSHLEALRRFVASDDAYAVVLEDDSRMHPNFMPRVRDMIERANLDLMAIHEPSPTEACLGIISGGGSKGGRENDAFTAVSIFASGNYIISRRAAVHIIEKYSKPSGHVDLAFSSALYRDDFRVVTALDPLVWSTPLEDSTTGVFLVKGQRGFLGRVIAPIAGLKQVRGGHCTGSMLAMAMRGKGLAGQGDAVHPVLALAGALLPLKATLGVVALMWVADFVTTGHMATGREAAMDVAAVVAGAALAAVARAVWRWGERGG